MSEKRRTRIIAVLNQKGGVGKSVMSFHIAQAAAEFGRDGKPGKVLAIDLDTQGDFSQYLTSDLDIAKKTKTGAGLFLEAKQCETMATSNPNIELLHGHKKLDRYDHDNSLDDHLLSPEWREFMRSMDYDVIVIDTPPAVGIRQVGPICWADLAVIPIEPDTAAIARFQDVLELIENEVSALNPELKWVGVINRILNLKWHKQNIAMLEEHYGSRILAKFSTRSAVVASMGCDPARPVWKGVGVPAELRRQWLESCKEVLAVK